jgi:anthranilate phosphoribosyltransferase
MAPVMAAVLAERGDTALVFRGDDGLDELTTTTTSSAWVAVDGAVVAATVDPAALGIDPVAPEQLRGADKVYNAGVVREVLAGGAPGVREVVLLNAAAAIAAYDGLSAERLHDALGRGLRLAAEAIDSGAAGQLLDRWVAASRAAAGDADT